MDLHIQRLECHYRMAAPAGEARLLQNRLDAIAADWLPRLLEGALADLGGLPNPSGGEEPYIFIDSLQVGLGLALGQGGDYDLARQWARGLEHGIQRSLQRGEAGVRIFWRRADYLASYIRDLLNGSARGHWIYDEFSGLENGSAGEAALQVLTADGDQGREALLELAHSGDLERLLGLLTEGQTEQLVQVCLLPRAPHLRLRGSLALWVEALTGFFSRGRLRITSVPAADLARGYLSLLVERPDLGPDVNLARFLDGLLRMRRETGSGTWNKLVHALQQDDWRSALGLVAAPHQDWLSGLRSAVEGPQLADLLEGMAPASPAALRRVSSPLAGAYLLGRAAMRLELVPFLETCPFPAPSGITKRGLLFWLLLAGCLGAEQSESILKDEGLAMLAGLAHPPDPQSLQDYAAALQPQDYSAMQTAWQAHLERLSRRREAHLLAPPVDLRSESAGQFALPFEGSLRSDPAFGALWAALAPLSAQLLAQFAAVLGGFAGSSPAYLRRNFLLVPGEIEVFADRWVAHLRTPPLGVVLRMAGLDGATWELGWLDGIRLEVRFD